MGNFFLVYVNYVAVLLCGVAAMAIGALWYGPLLGKPWMKLVGWDEKKMAKEKENMAKTYGLMFGASLLIAYTLAHFIWYAAPGSLTLVISLKTAVWCWVGLILPYAVSRHLFSPGNRSLKLLAIDTGYYLVTLLVMAVIFASLQSAP